MRYMILIHSDEQAEAKATQGDREQMYAAYGKYSEDLKKAGAMLAGDALLPTAKGAKVRMHGGKRTVVDGPFTETKEVLGGYYLINAKNLAEALEWGARCPSAASGTIEVREVAEMMG